MIHIVITDTDTGEIVIEKDCMAIVGGLCTTEDDAIGIVRINTDKGMHVGLAIAAAVQAVQEVFNHEPDIKNAVLDAFKEDGDEE